MESRTQDIARQTIIIASAVFMLIAAAVGSGAFGGTSVSELQDGALSAQGSYLAPAGPAFSIWSLSFGAVRDGQPRASPRTTASPMAGSASASFAITLPMLSTGPLRA